MSRLPIVVCLRGFCQIHGMAAEGQPTRHRCLALLHRYISHQPVSDAPEMSHPRTRWRVEGV